MEREIAPLDAYIHELKQYAAFAPCDDNLRRFVIQDFVPSLCSLKVCSY